MAMKFADREYILKKMKQEAELTKEMNAKDHLKAVLGLQIADLEGHPLYTELMKRYPDIDTSTTLSTLRTLKIFEKMFVESSQKALELSYKLDGSMSDLSIEVDFNEIDDGTEGIK